MHYIFVDEAYSRMETRTKIAVASWAVEQTAWGRQAERFAELYRAPLLDSLSSMFEALDSRASISAADLENTVFRSGEIDGNAVLAHYRSLRSGGSRAGRIAGHTPDAIAKEAAMHRKHAKARAAWNPAMQPTWLTEQVFSEKIQPALAKASTTAIARRIGVSRWYAGRIREGYRPHPRHWLTLAHL